MSAIDEKYTALGGSSGFLGQPTLPEQDCPDHRGRYRHFQGGSIYWAPDTDAHEVHGLIRGKWAALGWERSFLGYPLTDETSTPDGVGRFNHFQGGSIYWTPQTGAHEVHGAIREKWASLGWERSALGYPTTDEQSTEVIIATPAGQPPPPPTPLGRPGRYSDFQHGSIYWSPQTGPYVVSAGIPQQHRSAEADVRRGPCPVHVTGGWLSGLVRIASTLATSGFWTYDPVNNWVDVGRIFPEWVPVEGYTSVVLEGEVVRSDEDYPFPSVSFQDLPISHYTHDFNFAVRPDPTPDNRYTNLLGGYPRISASDSLPSGLACRLLAQRGTTLDITLSV